MLVLEDKILYLNQALNKVCENYADTFRTDILFFFDDFSVENNQFKFLNNLHSFYEIEQWIHKLTSRIVMKEDLEDVSNIIWDYLEMG